MMVSSVKLFGRRLFLGGLLLSVSSTVFANAPVGVRPCCAFGKDLKAQVGGVPVPFFSVGNVLDAKGVGNHKYNDGSQGISSSLLGIGEEHNGLIFTQKGGFIDTAHVRDTADFTYYLFSEIRHLVGIEAEITLPTELRDRVIVSKRNAAQLKAQEKNDIAVDIAGVMAFRLAQWHEIAQWFGLVSVAGFKELASAYSPEDLYSNMLGAKLAMSILRKTPDLSLVEFGKAMDIAFAERLSALGAMPENETSKRIEALDGKWWDSSKRLPDKWVLLHRDYHLALSLAPNGVDGGEVQSLPTELVNGNVLSDWAQFEVRAAREEKAFVALPDSLKSKTVWTEADFQSLADFAQMQDTKVYSR
ncbi:hypothetical protein GCE9029_02306 [Grimontia celer]|uniref:DUF4056 domain-containing protein n=1 Tax=Grimontia celer TaxID=1796497 RepID=A0A128F3W4_9GAMM|nr:DUF4056 domain-containing protein [Grimontia celer]CZF80956.1 hypothetical protein GCE9029_02306 [Grimontia celer]